MKLNRFVRPRSIRANRQITHSAMAARPLIESLEERQLMSLSIALRTTSGASTATATSNGEVIGCEVLATVSGNDAASTDGLDTVTGSILSTETSSANSVAGNLSALIPPEFRGNSAESGTSQDLNGDGNLDVGSNDNTSFDGDFSARAGGLATDGTVSGNSMTFFIGYVTYTVTNLHAGAATDVYFRLAGLTSAGGYDAIWQQDGISETDAIATVQSASPLIITGANVTPPTSTAAISGTVNEVANKTTSGFAHVAVTLTDSSGLNFSTLTGFDGTYSFAGLPAGTYDIRQTVPSGYTQTSPTSSPTVVTLGNGQSATGENFTDTLGKVTPTTGSIAGVVSKVVGGVTSGFSGVTVSLTDSGGLDITTPTSSSGAYSFTGLPAGTYDVSESVPSGYTKTSPTSSQIAVTLATGQNATGENFTDTANSTTPTTGSIAGTVSKVVSGVSSGFAGVTVVLTDSGGLDITTPTSSSGTYSFTGLPAGTYDVHELLPSGYTETSPTSNQIAVTLGTGQNATGANFIDTANPTTTATPLKGTVIGTAGSFGNDGNTIAKAFDGNLATFYDGASASGDWAGLNLGSEYTISSVSYSPRSGWASRMVGGIFQGSNDPNFATGVVNLATITATPATGVYTTLAVSNTSAFEYVRYLSPANSYGNVAELNFYGTAVKTVTPTPLSGSVIGTSGSFQNDGNTIAKAFDGNLSTFFDGATANGNWAGLNLGSQFTISSINYSPRAGWAARMVGGIFQGSNSPTFASGVVNLATITATPVVGSFTSISVTSTASFQYVRYLSPNGSYGDVAEIQFFGKPATSTITKLSGSVIGTSGSFKNSGNTIANAFDGNLNTFFDGPVANGNWAGLNLGSAKSIGQISYAPRAGWAARMVGGIFQASNTADFSSGVVNLYTITATPAYNTLTTVSVDVSGTYQYVRYLSPNGSYGDVAEIAFFS